MKKGQVLTTLYHDYDFDIQTSQPEDDIKEIAEPQADLSWDHQKLRIRIEGYIQKIRDQYPKMYHIDMVYLAVYVSVLEELKENMQATKKQF